MRDFATALHRCGWALAALLWLAGPLQAQENPSPEETLALQRLQPRLGLFGNAGLNIHTGDFTGAPISSSFPTLDELLA